MAQSLETIRRVFNQTSIHGRRLFLDFEGFLAGIKGIRNVVTNATSATTATALPNHGHVTVFTTTNDTWTLTDPIPGGEVSITFSGGTTSTGIATISPAAATIQSCGSSTGGSITLTGSGAGIKLVGLTTALWAPVGRYGTSAQTFVTT